MLDALLLGHAAHLHTRGTGGRIRGWEVVGELAAIGIGVEITHEVLDIHATPAMPGGTGHDRLALGDRARGAREAIAREDPRGIGPTLDDAGNGHVVTDLRQVGSLQAGREACAYELYRSFRAAPDRPGHPSSHRAHARRDPVRGRSDRVHFREQPGPTG